MLIDLIAVAITLFFILGSAYLGAMRSLVKIASFFGSAILSLLLFPWMQKSALYHVGVQWMERQLAAKGMDVIELNITEILKAGGGPHCMTFPLLRG